MQRNLADGAIILFGVMLVWSSWRTLVALGEADRRWHRWLPKGDRGRWRMGVAAVWLIFAGLLIAGLGVLDSPAIRRFDRLWGFLAVGLLSSFGTQCVLIFGLPPKPRTGRKRKRVNRD